MSSGFEYKPYPAVPSRVSEGKSAPTAPAQNTANALSDLDARFALIRSVGEECVTEAELRNLLEKKPNFQLYDGFEPSGGFDN
jgi:tyrosyl-tRNA synthetase